MNYLNRSLKIFVTCFLFNLSFITATVLASSGLDKFHDAFLEGIKSATYHETDSGNSLRYTCFKSPVEGSSKDLLFIQGRGTFLEFYEVLVTPFLEQGINVWMYDLSGQGGSSRLLKSSKHDQQTVQCMQHIDSFDLYSKDANHFVKNVILPQIKGPLFLVGYSTGGHVALRYLQLYPHSYFKAAIVISPLLQLKSAIPTIAFSYSLGCASYLTSLEKYFTGRDHTDRIFSMTYETNPYTTDRAAFDEMKDLCRKNPSFMMGGVSYGWVKAASDSIRSLWTPKAIQSLDIPILIVTGGDDEVINTLYHTQFVNQLAKGEHLFLPTGKHELFREAPEMRSAFWSTCKSFLNEKSGESF